MEYKNYLHKVVNRLKIIMTSCNLLVFILFYMGSVEHFGFESKFCSYAAVK